MSIDPEHRNDHVPAREPKLLTINDVADLLRVPVATLRYWRNTSYGPPSFRIGRGVRYWDSEVLNWLHQLSGHDGPHAA